MTIREVRSADREAVLKLCRERPYPDSLFMDPDEMRRTVVGQLDAFFGAPIRPPNLLARVLLEENRVAGFLLLEVNETESITRQSQTVVCDYHAESAGHFAALVEHAREEARRRGDEYLVVSHYRHFEERVPWLEKCGFKPELVRVARAVGPGHQAAEHPDFRVRRATDNDMLFIMRLVSGHSPIYRPAHRQVDTELIQQGFINAYTHISPRDKKRVPLVLEERGSGELAGYIIVEPGRVLGQDPRLTLYIYDVAVDPEYPRRGMSRYLCGGGEMLLARMGGGVFYGDISADNDLALGAQKGLGFTVDSVRWGLPV